MKSKNITRADKMLNLMHDWESSNLNINDFCISRGVGRSTFHYWKKKFREQGTISVKKAHTQNRQDRQKGHFIPIVPEDQTAVSSQLHINYPNGVSITCCSMLSPNQLQTLIKLC